MEIIMEVVIEGTMTFWAYFAEWICKGKPLTKLALCLITVFSAIFAVAGLFSVLVGIGVLFDDTILNKTSGICHIVIPIVLSVVQITAGLIIKKKKK